jgi:hypothetical protein
MRTPDTTSPGLPHSPLRLRAPGWRSYLSSKAISFLRIPEKPGASMAGSPDWLMDAISSRPCRAVRGDGLGVR